jgi:anaerobic selenocysteine-containing dehydrogenase
VSTEARTTLHATTCPLDCPDACGVLAEVGADGALMRLRGNPAHSYSGGVLCGKTMLYPELVHSADRLTSPLVRVGGKSKGELVPATWDEAIGRIHARVKPLAGEDILALWYGGSMGLVQRKFPLRMMHALGATLHDGGICDSASTAGYENVLGRIVGPDIEEADECDLVVLWGSDVARTVQHLQPALQRLCRRGVPVVAIDVYRTDTIESLEKWGGRGLVIRPGTDAALALAVARIAFEEGFADRPYLEGECFGAAEFESHVRRHLDREEAAAITGLDVAEIDALVRLFQRSKRPLIKTGVGWTRRRNGAMSMRAVCSLAAVLGAGDRVHYESFGHFGLAEDAVIRPDLRPPAASSELVQQVALGRELSSGRFKAVFVWCHNPAVTLPDSRRVRAGLARDDLFVVVHEHFLTETAELADVVLPATMFMEHDDVYRSYGHRWMQLARAASRAPEGAKSNVETFAAIARALGLPREAWDVDALGVARELLAASRPRLSDDEIARLERGEPVKPHSIVHSDRGTPSGKIELVSAAAAALGQPRMATYVADDAAGDRGAFWLVGAPSVHTHNSTFAHSARHVKKNGPPTCHVNPEDARGLGLAEGARARITNERGALTLPIVFSSRMPRGLVRVDGLPRARDFREGVGLNALTSGALSDLGDGNVMYSARVDLLAASAARG